MFLRWWLRLLFLHLQRSSHPGDAEALLLLQLPSHIPERSLTAPMGNVNLGSWSCCSSLKRAAEQLTGRLQGSPGARRLPSHFCSSGSGWLVYSDGAGAAPAAPGAGCEGLPPTISPAPTACVSPLQPLHPVLSLSPLSEQLTWGSSKKAGCLGRKSCWKSLLQMYAAVHSFHSTSRAVCQAARGGGGSRSRGQSPCLPGHGVTSLHVAGPLGQELLPVGSAGQSRHIPSTSPGLWPCPVLTESSEWDFQCFLWQRSLQTNYLTLTSFLLV